MSAASEQASERLTLCRPALTRYPTAGERMECSTGNASNVIPQIFVGVRSLNHVAILDRVMPQFLARFFRRIHRTRRTPFQSPRVIGMGMREHDRVRIHTFEFS